MIKIFKKIKRRLEIKKLNKINRNLEVKLIPRFCKYCGNNLPRNSIVNTKTGEVKCGFCKKIVRGPIKK